MSSSRRSRIPPLRLTRILPSASKMPKAGVAAPKTRRRPESALRPMMVLSAVPALRRAAPRLAPAQNRTPYQTNNQPPA